MLDTMQSRLRGRPGEAALDFTLNRALLRLALRDTAAAERQLDVVLDALPTLGQFVAREEAQSAAVGRSMLLRAEIAMARRDSATARRWASNALALWSGADAPLQPTLSRLRFLAGR
jgi:hypothetical protein